jgi:protease II
MLVLFSTIPLIAASLHYPEAPPGNVVDSYHGVRVPDPYRWLEDPDSPASKKWIKEENALTASYLSTVPNIANIKGRLTALWSPVVYPTNGFAQRNGRWTKEFAESAAGPEHVDVRRNGRARILVGQPRRENAGIRNRASRVRLAGYSFPFC